jgi:hypothetical protein
MTEEYYHDYPNEPIGGDNPYYRCSYCKRSDPEINGYIERHEEWCEYRIKKTRGTGMTERTQKILETFLHEPKFSKRNEISSLINVLREIVSDYESWEDGTYMVKSKDILEIADELDELEDT